jgi:hypothetical protein
VKPYGIIIEVHRSVLAENKDDAEQQANRLRESIESQCGDASVYLESVEEESA